MKNQNNHKYIHNIVERDSISNVNKIIIPFNNSKSYRIRKEKLLDILLKGISENPDGNVIDMAMGRLSPYYEDEEVHFTRCNVVGETTKDLCCSTGASKEKFRCIEIDYNNSYFYFLRYNCAIDLISNLSKEYRDKIVSDRL
jgi:hypothetical protein